MTVFKLRVGLDLSNIIGHKMFDSMVQKQGTFNFLNLLLNFNWMLESWIAILW